MVIAQNGQLMVGLLELPVDVRGLVVPIDTTPVFVRFNVPPNATKLPTFVVERPAPKLMLMDGFAN